MFRRLVPVPLVRIASVVALAGAVACGGCEDEPQKNNSPGEAALTVEPPSQEFGSVAVGATSDSATVVVTNEGSASSTMLSVNLGGTNPGDFTIVADNCAGMTLDVDDSCEVELAFAPSTAGDRTANLEVSAAEGGEVVAALTGVGTAPGALTITPTPYSFGSVVINESSEPVDFTVSNTGGAPTAALTANLNAGDAVDFEITDDGCTGEVLAVDGTCVVSVRFSPGNTGMRATTLRVADGADVVAEAALSGTGESAPILAVVGMGFGSVPVGSSSPEVAFVVENQGGGSTGPISSAIAGPDLAEFTVVTDGCADQQLAANEQCSIVLRFDPATVGVKDASLDVSATPPGGTASVSLIAEGIAAGFVAIAPSTNDFGTAAIGSTGASIVLTVTNGSAADTGALDLTFGGANTNDFVFVSGQNGCQGQVLAPAATCDVAVAFTPTAAGQRTADLTVVGVPGGTATAALAGVGETAAAFQIAPPAQDFGTVATGATSTATTFTVTNVGAQTSGAPTVALGGTGSAEFAIVANGCTAPLTTGNTCTIDVRFEPAAVGTASATLDVSGTPGGSASSALTGTAIAPTALSTSTSTMSFGNVVNGGSSATQTVVVSNSGSLSGTIAVAATGDFVVTADTCTGNTLDMGDTCTITVTFSPTTVGALTGSLSIDALPGGTLTVALGGTSLPEFTFAPATPDPYDFGDHLIGALNPPSQVFTVTNTAGVGAIARNLTAALVPATNFAVLANTCTGNSVAAGATCSVTVEFDPVGPPGSHTAALSVTDQNAVVRSRALTGRALSNSPLDLSPTTWAFANQAVGTTNTVTFTVTNTTNAASGPLHTNFSAIPLPFGIVSDTCAGNTLDAFGGANDACEIVVIFYPTTVGSFGTATLSVSSPTANTAIASITGTAVNPAKLTFDAPAVPATTIATTSWQRTLTLRNTGALATGPVSVALTGSSVYRIVTNNCGAALAPAASCTIVIEGAPTTTDALGAQVGTFTATATPGGPGSVDVTTNVLPQIVRTTPASPYTFPATIAPGMSAPVNFTVQNQTAVAVAAPVVAVTGPFVIVTNACTTVPASGSCNVSVRFQPTAPGDAQAGTLEIGSGAAGTARWDLVGDGTQDAQLAWDAALTDFGRAAVSSTGLTRTFVLRNVGGLATAGVPAFAFNPATNPQFTVNSAGCAAPLGVDATCDVVVTFQPTSAGAKSLGITASATGAGGTPTNAALTITGDAVTPGGFTLAPLAYQFTETPVVGSTSTEFVTYTATNNTGGALNNLTVAVSGNEFSLRAGQDNCSGANLANGQSCTFQLEFSPTALGNQTATVTVRRGGTRADASVFGVAVGPPTLQLLSGDPAFGPVAIGIGATRTFTFENVGDVGATSVATALTGLNAGQFSVQTNGCAAGVAAGATCDIDVRFLPLAVATGLTATLAVTPNTGNGASLTLTGDGATPPTLVVTPAGPVDCGNAVPAGGSQSCGTFTVANTGGLPTGDFDLVLGSLVDFEITGTTCATTGSTPAYAALAGGASCTVDVAYVPDSISPADLTTFGATDGVSSDFTNLNGDSVSALTTPASSTTQTFTATAGSATSLTFTYTNAAGTPAAGPLNVWLTGTHASLFSVAGDCSGATLPAGGTCTVRVTFTPTAVASNRTATLNVGAGTPNKTAAPVSLVGNGT